MDSSLKRRTLNLRRPPPKPWLDGNQIDALFKQGKIWIDANLETHSIKKMSDHHLMYTHRFVRRHYRRWWNSLMLGYMIGIIEPSWKIPLGVDWEPEELDYHLGAGMEPDLLPKSVYETTLFKALSSEMVRRGIQALPLEG